MTHGSDWTRRRWLQAAVLGGLAGRLECAAADAGTGEAFRHDPSWPALSAEVYPEARQFAGIAIGAGGKVLALNRGENFWPPGLAIRERLAQEPVVLEIGATDGKLMKSWGSNLCMMPHQISVDAAGRVWIVDCGANKVFRCAADGRTELEIGGPEIGFNMPTDVAFLKDGSFVVSDGYKNSRVVKFDPSGRKMAEWGAKGKGPLQFATPHSVAVDEAERIYVADRENHRMQILNAQGELLGIWTNVERPLTVRYRAGSLWVLSNLEADAAIVRQLDLEGKVIASFKTKPAGVEGDFEWPHGLAVSEDGQTVYVGYAKTGRRVQRWVRGKA